MMIGFSCFPTPIPCHKTKKGEEKCSHKYHDQEVHKDSPISSSDTTLKGACLSATEVCKMEKKIPSECECDFEEQNAVSYMDEKVHTWNMGLRKSQSVGGGLHGEGSFYCDTEADDKNHEIDQELPSHDFDNLVNLHGNSGLQELHGSNDDITRLLYQNNANTIDLNADLLSNGSKFFIEDMPFDTEFCQRSADRSHNCFVGFKESSSQHVLSKYHSLPSLEMYESSSVSKFISQQSRSVEDLCTLDVNSGHSDIGRGNNSRMSILQCSTVASFGGLHQKSDMVEERENSEAKLQDDCISSGADKEHVEVSYDDKVFVTQSRNHIFENKFNDDYDSHSAIASLNDYGEPKKDAINHSNIEYSETTQSHELNSKILNIKRIEEWISQIDIHGNVTDQTVGENSSYVYQGGDEIDFGNGVNATKAYAKGSGVNGAAYTYISSLAPASTSAQMANLGLVVIPFISAFSSLRVLNLSCNAIVKITSGALPRGLHILNLSRNNISVIEGLRELSRLRILDLSYNRIVRIGHGLAACSSLRELYLAGNKISEVEGLHRLLKLNIIDLKSNKISMTKCLGQLAANFASLQAINLEGNPVQRNVGEEQLKKYLLSLLPRLVYFNKHAIKATSSMKELSDWPARSSSSRLFDRSTRSDHKHTRRGSHTSVTRKVASSDQLRVVQAKGSSAKPSRHRYRHVPLPMAGSKEQQLHSMGSKLLSGVHPMRRSRSEGNL